MNRSIYKMLFGRETAPEIPLTLKELPNIAQELVGKLSISGVQPKLSLKLDRKTGQLVPTAKGGEFILKPQIATYESIPENENCCMDIADELGITVPPQCLLPLRDKTLAYVVKRFDRKGKAKIHQENFLQILNKQDKYSGSLEEIGRAIREYSSVPGLDTQLFFERVVLFFVLGNGDAHFQNFSMIHSETGEIRFSPAYDIVCTKLVIKNEEDSALSLNGKKNKLLREDFDSLAEYLKIPEKVRYQELLDRSESISAIIENSQLPQALKTQFQAIVQERWARLRF